MKVLSSVSRGIDKWAVRNGVELKRVELCEEHHREFYKERIELAKAFGAEKNKTFRGLSVVIGRKCLTCWDLGGE